MYNYIMPKITINNINFYVSEKCGVSYIYNFIKKNNDKLKTLTNINILILRNPIDRIIGFYCDKVLNLSYTLEDKKNQGDQFQIQNNIGINVDYNKSSFSDFVHELNKINIYKCDPHLSSQSLNYDKNVKYDFIIDTKNIIQEFKNIFCNINQDIECDLNFKESNKTIRQEYNYHIYDKNISELKKIGGVPNNNTYFLNKKIINILYKIYKEDFDLYSTFFDNIYIDNMDNII